jgi:hypothetical protein
MDKCGETYRSKQTVVDVHARDRGTLIELSLRPILPLGTHREICARAANSSVKPEPCSPTTGH